MPYDSLELPRKKKPPRTGASSFPTVSQSSIFDLKALVAEHESTFQKEGKHAVKGQGRGGVRDMSRDKFDRPSPGIIARMAHSHRTELRQSRSHGASSLSIQDADVESREAEQRRSANMKRKAEKYAALRRGEVGGLTEKELQECPIDFERKWQEGDAWSDHPSDEDESANVPEDLRIRDDDDRADDYDQIEYVDELGRTRRGTRKDAREAEEARRAGVGGSKGVGTKEGERERLEGVKGGEREVGYVVGPAHEEVMQSNVIYGAQSFFPVYEPSQEERIERIKAAEGPAERNHYDAAGDVRDRAAGAYQFSQDEAVRASQMESLKRQREETEAARRAASQRTELTAAQEIKKRKLDERRALIESKRRKVVGADLGGAPG